MAIERPASNAECKYTVVDVANNSTVVHPGPAILFSVWVNTALSAHALPIMDGATTLYTIAASAPVNTKVDFPGVRCETSLVIDPNDAATGNVIVCWMPV